MPLAFPIGIYTSQCAGGAADISRWRRRRKHSGSLSSFGGAPDQIWPAPLRGVGNWSDTALAPPPPA